MGGALPYLWIKLQRDPVFWVLNYIWSHPGTLFLFVFWMGCTLLAIAIVRIQDTKATTTVRKYFHALVVAVFTSGVLVDPGFLYLSTIVSLCLMSLLEYMRLHKIEPVATILEKSFGMFQDEKDTGKLVLTNIYLLAGAALPLWICPDVNKAQPLTLLSGVISIGIGDSFASIVGSRYGRKKLFGTRKTLEGLMAAIFSQLVFVKGLEFLNLLTIHVSSFHIVTVVIVVSLTEALTTQIDNIALPLLMYLALNY